MLIFFYLREEAACNEDGRVACAARYLADRLDYSEKVIRNALRELVTAGMIEIETKSRLYTMVRMVSNRRKGAEKGAEKGAVKALINQHESSIEGAEKGAGKGATGVTAVRRSSGVDVSPDVKNKSGETTARATPPVYNFKSTAKARYEAAIARAPDLPHVTMHIDRLFADLSAGSRYPWSGNPTASTLLSDLIASHGPPLVMAAAERFFQRGDHWIEERAWSIDEFSKQFAKFIAMPGVAKRRTVIEVELNVSTRPTTPNELRAKLEAMRRRQREPVLA